MSTTFFVDSANAVRSRYKTLITDVVSPTLIVHHDNQLKDTPDYPEDRFVRVSVKLGESKQISIGTSKVFRTPGVMIVQIFWELGLGTKESDELADVIRNSFQSVTASGIVWQTPSIVSVGRTNTWWQTNVVCPFYSDDII